LPTAGFRLPRSVPTRDGAWLAPDGWIATTYVPGRHATAEDVPACLAAIRALHEALRTVPKHPLLDRNNSVCGHADRA
ncbi:MAG: aminoglycoside phosphotransferase, partial [Chloroflexota bacterium]|nr:aminoglycoside phosphotransferase [Chloroflexota bacterium]